MKHLLWLAAASALVLACEPTAALAAGAGSSRVPTTARVGHHAPQSHVAAAPVGVLAIGTGYASVDGSQRVRALQRRLARVGEVPGPIDGRFGPLTEQAVARFQTSQGLQVDGIAGPRTLAALTAPTVVLYPGAGYQSGGSERVRALQRRLARAGDVPGPVDGLYGPLTEQAVVRFQVGHGLQADGIAGPKTVTRLEDVAGAQQTLRSQPTPRSASHHPSAHVRASQPAHVRASQPAHVRASQPGHVRAPGHVSGAGHPSNSPVTLWLVLLGIVGLALLVIAALYGRQRRRPRSPERFVPSREPVKTGNGAVALDHNTMVGVRLEGHRDLAGAEAAYRRADNAGDAIGTFNLGVLLERQEDLAGAEAAYRRADKRGHVSAGFNLGVLLESQQDLVGAEAAYRRADERGHAAAASNLGALLEEQGDLVGAEAAYSRADGRGEATGAFNLGVLLEGRDDLAGAEAAYRRADKRGHAAAASNLGVLLERQNDVVGAEAAYRRADGRGDATGAFNLAVLLEERHDIVGAQEAYQRADKRDDADVARMARDALGVVDRGPEQSGRSPLGGDQHVS